MTYFSILFLFAGFWPYIFGQPLGPGGGNFEGPGPRAKADGSGLLKKLTWALDAAGGETLSVDQEEKIAALVDEMKANRPEPDPENRGPWLMRDYGEAVLNGDIGAIADEGGIADQLAARMAERATRQMITRAEFQIALLGILNDGQKDALREQVGEQGLLRLLNPRGRGGNWARLGARKGGVEGFSRGRMSDAGRNQVSGP
jgi:hypothetical protein